MGALMTDKEKMGKNSCQQIDSQTAQPPHPRQIRSLSNRLQILEHQRAESPHSPLPSRETVTLQWIFLISLFLTFDK